MKLIEFFKKLAKSKVTITINIVDPRVEKPEEAINSYFLKNDKVVNVNNIVPPAGTQFRFVEEETTKAISGKKSYFYSTEYWDGNRWTYVSESGASDKSRAMSLHNKILAGTPIKDTTEKTVLYQGLNSEQSKTWQALNS